jgi:hypothetical protein
MADDQNNVQETKNVLTSPQKHRVKNLLADYKAENVDNFKFNTVIPTPRFSILNVGPTKSGKSNVIMHLLTDELIIKDEDNNKKSVFEIVILMTQSAQSDPLFMHTLNKPENAFLKNIVYLTDSLDLEILENVLQLDNNGKHRMILIDDFGNDRKMLTDPTVQKLFMMGRHNNTSVCLNVQDYYSCPPSIKSNCSHMIIFNLNKRDREIALFNDLASQTINSDDVKDMYLDATEKQYQFLLVNMQSTPRKFFLSLDFEYKLE